MDGKQNLSNIFKVDIDKNYDYTFLELLNSLPKHFALIFMKLLEQDIVDIKDLKVVIAKLKESIYYRSKYYDYDIRTQLVNKLKGNEITSVVQELNFNPEKVIIYNLLAEIGIYLSSNEIDDIFVDEKNIQMYSLNYYEIENTGLDNYFFNEYFNMSSAKIKKEKQLHALQKLWNIRG